MRTSRPSMRPTIYHALAGSALLMCAVTSACAQSPTAAAPGTTAASREKEHDKGQDGFTWGPAPAVFPAGAQMAVLAGNPGGTGEFTVRLRFPNGYRIAPHTHPTDEHVTVIAGTLDVGMGTTFEEKGMLRLDAGGFVTAPAGHAHYVRARGHTVVQVHAMGPFALTYVNPSDLPKAGGTR